MPSMFHQFILYFLLTRLTSDAYTSQPPSTAPTEWPRLSISSPPTQTLLWGNPTLDLELVPSNSVTGITNIQICLDLIAHSSQNLHQCYPVNLSGEIVGGEPLLTQMTLEIEDAGFIVVKAYIKDCPNDIKHCHSTIKLNTCRTNQFGVLQGGSKCKSNWNDKNTQQTNKHDRHDVGHTPETPETNANTNTNTNANANTNTNTNHHHHHHRQKTCTRKDLTLQCTFHQHSMCFDAQNRKWLVQTNEFDTNTFNVFHHDPASFLDMFVGPYSRSINEGVAIQLQSDIDNSSPPIDDPSTTILHSGRFVPVVPYMSHVFFHAVADNAFHIYALLREHQHQRMTSLLSGGKSDSSSNRNTIVLLLAKAHSKYDYFLEKSVGQNNVQYLGELVSATAIATPVNATQRVLHCFETAYTGILRRNTEFNLLPQELHQRHRFNTWHSSTLSSFRTHMLVAAKILDIHSQHHQQHRTTVPHLTMLVHRARSEAQSMPGDFITTQIRQIINRNELWNTVQNIVTTRSDSCHTKTSLILPQPPQLPRSAIHTVLEDLSFNEQLTLLSQTEIFIHMHGSAGVMSFFYHPVQFL